MVNLCLVVFSQSGHCHSDAVVDTILQFGSGKSKKCNIKPDHPSNTTESVSPEGQLWRLFAAQAASTLSSDPTSQSISSVWNAIGGRSFNTLP